MKKSIYITLALAGILSMNSCNDDEFLPGNPSMEIKAENADALSGKPAFRSRTGRLCIQRHRIPRTNGDQGRFYQ